MHDKDSEEQLKSLQEEPPSPRAKRAHMARYLRDNAYYTLRDMDLTAFSLLYPFDGCERVGSAGGAMEDGDYGNNSRCGDRRAPLEGARKRSEARGRARTSENIVQLHHMTARLSLLTRKNGKKQKKNPEDDVARKTIGIFAKMKETDAKVESIESDSKAQAGDEKGSQATVRAVGLIEHDIQQIPPADDSPVEIATLSVDSIDNIITSDTTELDYHRHRHSSQSYGGLFDNFIF